MSAVDIDRGSIPSQVIVPVFEQGVIDDVMAEFGRTPLAAVENTNIDQMNASGNWPLVDLHLGLIGQTADMYGEAAGRSMSAGYMAGYSILARTATAEHPLPIFTPEQVKAYVYHAETPNSVGDDISRDYKEHEVVLRFLAETLKSKHSRGGAQLLFGLHGRWANPGREPIRLPDPPPILAPVPNSRRSNSIRGTAYGQAMDSLERYGLKSTR